MSEPPIETTASSVMSPRQRRRAGTASALGTCIEAGDLVMYAFLVVYTAPLWFPSNDPAVSVVATLGVYGVGFLARPLGGLFFGRMGDRAGRRRTLVVTLALMGLATLSLGLIPTYETIGVFAPVLVILARILQGFAAGGEVMGAATYALESSSPGRRGLYSSLTPFGSYIGLFMATAVIGITNIIVGSAAMAAWGWRIPFFVGFVLTIALLMFRLRVEDSAEFTVLKKNNMIAKTPLRDTWRDHKLTILLTVLMGSGILYAAYSINTYVPVYLTTVTGLSRSEVPWMTAVVFLLASPAAIMGGLLADRFGRVRVLTIGLIAFGLSGIPVFAILADASFGIIGIGAVFFVAVVLGALLIAPAYQTFADIFPTRIRFTAAAIGFNLANMIGAGFGPLLSAEVIRSTGSPQAPGWMLLVAVAVGIAGLLGLVRLHRSRDGAPGADRADAEIRAVPDSV